MSGFVVNAVTPEDIDPIVAIASFSGLSRWSANDYENEIGRSDTIFRKCADVSCNILGFIIGRVVPGSIGESALDAEIYNIAVVDAFRRQGVGSILLQDFIRECDVFDIKTIWLEVRFGNTVAKEFYKRLGFSAVTIRRSFYADPVEDAIVMNRTL